MHLAPLSGEASIRFSTALANILRRVENETIENAVVQSDIQENPECNSNQNEISSLHSVAQVDRRPLRLLSLGKCLSKFL
jgi:hypothetical protein